MLISMCLTQPSAQISSTGTSSNQDDDLSKDVLFDLSNDVTLLRETSAINGEVKLEREPKSSADQAEGDLDT